ncbi:hypothetical protein SAMN05421693_101146 [Ectothiorhodospira magna]|uniref:Uncharacterized protein n=1 Tax=Ectothiorhodospira magna TaxID=867345 RepID=A0A1H8Z4H2_9GAMM|nr:hypothetical protein SAMN05421693_101146 [Ectothiorhodospira magna]
MSRDAVDHGDAVLPVVIPDTVEDIRWMLPFLPLIDR